MTVTPLTAGLLATLFATLGLVAISGLRDRGPLDRFDREDADGPQGRQGPLARLVERLAASLGPRFLRSMSAQRREKIAYRLDLAGRPGGMTVQRYVGLRSAIFTLWLLFTGAFVLFGATPLMLVFGAIIGWFGMEVWVSRQGRLRQERIERDLPDFLDILAVTVRAGLGYRSALLRVSESLGGPVAEEMVTALRQMDLGAQRRDAFLALRDRNRSESLAQFIAAQLQAEELGVPLSEALNDIAIDMRRASHQAARRRAQQAAPRVSLIVTTLIVPGSIVVILVSILLGSNITESGILG